jgi:hypothetical protein
VAARNSQHQNQGEKMLAYSIWLQAIQLDHIESETFDLLKI